MRALAVLLAVVLVAGIASAQVRIATAYNYPTLPGSSLDSVLNGLKSIRGSAAHMNPEGNGRGQVAVTNYNSQGRVHVFEFVGNDSMELIWTSPKPATGGASSTPRYILFGDLDKDGKIEIIYQSNANGIFIFEHDGIPGSHNYGTQPSQLITTPNLPNVTGNNEFMDIGDVDGDGDPELLVPYNASTNATDVYAIIGATPGSDWSTNDPGFSSFTTEWIASRTALSLKYGLDNGAPYAMVAGNLDGTGGKEVLLHAWNYLVVTPLRSTAKDTYVMADTTNNLQNVFLGGIGNDDVSLFGGMAWDIDVDGREEIYMPTFWSSGGSAAHAGWVHMITYAPGDNLAEIDSVKNCVRLSIASETSADIFGYGYGDIDGNGKRNLYFGGGWGRNVMSLEFQGGDKRNPANWVASTIYKGDSTIVTAVTYRDSLGQKDTLRTYDVSFVAKMASKGYDLDHDGNGDMIIPYQALVDSVTVRNLTWNTTNTKFDTVLTKIANPKRWGFRMLEKGSPTGIDVKDLTIINPDDYRLEQNYPNPFNPSTTISFSLPVRSRISLRVFDALGREVRTLIANEEKEKGPGSVVWNGRDNAGRTVASGTYFYTLRFGNFEKTNKMVLVK